MKITVYTSFIDTPVVTNQIAVYGTEAELRTAIAQAVREYNKDHVVDGPGCPEIADRLQAATHIDSAEWQEAWNEFSDNHLVSLDNIFWDQHELELPQ